MTWGMSTAALSLWLKRERSTANSHQDGRGKQDKWSPHVRSGKISQKKHLADRPALETRKQVRRPGWTDDPGTTKTPGVPMPHRGVGGEKGEVKPFPKHSGAKRKCVSKPLSRGHVCRSWGVGYVCAAPFSHCSTKELRLGCKAPSLRE